MSEEDREIFLTKEEVLKLPTHIKLAIVHRFPEKWHIIRKATLELLTTGKSPTYAELEAYARQIWRKPYTPWFLLKIRWERAGIETELVREDASYYELKGIRIKESVLKALQEKAKSSTL
uniref:Uncharacterized protein n=1 Tax=Thermococcus sp. AMT7 TaxID=1197730 RepID=L0B8L5_9EURY|nr:hypothetical protein [Thermococcus sp. AMT7]AFZ84295.1 hypothetical protein a7-7 [Thermococcus sp. AMT7]